MAERGPLLDDEAGEPQCESDSDQIQVTDIHTDGSEYERHHRSNEQNLGQSHLLGHTASFSRHQGSVASPLVDPADTERMSRGVGVDLEVVERVDVLSGLQHLGAEGHDTVVGRLEVLDPQV
jgi:hypothetical protein